MYKIKEIMNYLEDYAPISYSEEYDNVGLMIGDKDSKIRKIMFCLNVTPEVVKGAISNDVNFIISHHPLIFKGIKRIVYDNVKDKMIIDLIKNDISVYSAHTNLDFTVGGLNYFLAKRIKLENISNLGTYKYENLYKVSIFVPDSHLDIIKKVFEESKAGYIGKYSNCTFTSSGEGTFKALENTNPYIGKHGEVTKVDEHKIESVVEKKNLNNLITSIKKVHPYEEVAYDIYKLENKNNVIGFGCYGNLDNKIELYKYIDVIKKELNLKSIRVVGNLKKKVKNIAVFCGSIDRKVISSFDKNIDLLVTGEIKHHMALDIKQEGITALDAGHYGTEKIVVDLFKSLILKKFKDIDIVENNFEEDPIINI